WFGEAMVRAGPMLAHPLTAPRPQGAEEVRGWQARFACTALAGIKYRLSLA
ncbi:hypothetical protein, partial [Pseudomonas sp. FG-3G]